ncbi:PhoH family protein [Ramlibacter alkalitolerans]|uniref:PhoH family protein n=1 Tax=Ramlibacter alkalitolerans TaxID=2039631 RepID=A0ABS1JV18_9BURK|nr:PhoH family protein [Ramlibacter alkalitolerans]MBL0428042.1 PhoH family protein [Ramlibacter alkalitolerans]
MPLPPAPSKRAAMLPPEAFDAPARSSHKATRKTEAPAADEALVAERPQVLDDLTARGLGVGGDLQEEYGEVDTETLVDEEPAAPAAKGRKKEVTVPAPLPKKKKASGPKKMFVLDTNVLMHDPMSLFRFDEHDIFLPMVVLEELDGHKKGTTEVARNARQASRSLDALAGTQGADIAHGLRLDTTGHKEAGGCLFFQTMPLSPSGLPMGLPPGKADNQILSVVQALQEKHAPMQVVLVSKDINMRVKARALGLVTEDYKNDKTLDDLDLMYSGSLALPPDFWAKHGKTVESWQQGVHTFYRISGPIVPALFINQFVYFEAPGEPSLYARVIEIRGKTAVLKTLKDYGHLKNAVWGVTTRNREQNFAMNLLMDPEVDFVTLTGTAGTGKTLMALAAGLTQVLDERRYTEIIMTRATVSVGEDIGFLPGTEEEKMGPWMGALDDNLEVLGKTDGGAGEWGRAATNELIRSKIKIKSMNFMRGRTFLNKYVILDEAQNLTPKQMKTLVTRAGPGSKIICMGNLAQIDTPYLTEGSSGLTFAVDKFKGWPHSGHITLARGERSRLADFASEVL